MALSSPGQPLEEIAAREGVKTIAVPMERHISPFKDLKSLWRLYRTFRREKPDMVHSMTPKAGLLCMMASKMARVPVRLHTFTGLVFPTAKGITRKILIFTDRLTCACATHIVPEGEGVKNDLTNNKITKKPLKVLGYGNVRGIDLSHYNPEDNEVCIEAEKIQKDLIAAGANNESDTNVEQGLSAESSNKVFTFIFVGRLVRDKGINELVAAFSDLNRELPNTRLLLVGSFESELDPLLPETLAAIENNPAIKAVGRQSDVRPWFKNADALVFPSYREGFPNVVIEAGAMGLPSIVTDINGSREIIEDGRNGLIIPAIGGGDASPLTNRTQALTDAMRRMATDSDMREAMAREARPMVAARFEQGFVRSCLYEYYREILGK